MGKPTQDNEKSLFTKLKERVEFITNSENSQQPNNVSPNNNASNWRTKQKTQPVIAVSDLHGNMKKWEAIKRMIKYNPGMTIYILGDAMDRGNDGVEILLEIKKYCDMGRVKYIPGNHDMFAYNFMKYNFKNSKSKIEKTICNDAEYNLITNGGLKTVQQLRMLGENDIKTMKELTEWLGNLQLQRKERINGNSYALAHAVFDDEMYKWKPEFSMEEALMFYLAYMDLNNEIYYKKNKTNLEEMLKRRNQYIYIYKKCINIVDYREDVKRKEFPLPVLPEDSKMIVGHTHQERVNERRLFGCPIVYIDTGLDERNFAGYNLTYDCPQPLFIRDNPSRDPQKIH